MHPSSSICKYRNSSNFLTTAPVWVGQHFCWPTFFPKFAKILNRRGSHFYLRKHQHTDEQHKLWLSPMSIYHHCSLQCVQAMLSYQIRSKNLSDICANYQGLETSLRFMSSCKASFVWSIPVPQRAVPGWGDRQPSSWFMVLTSPSLSSPAGAVHRIVGRKTERSGLSLPVSDGSSHAAP